MKITFALYLIIGQYIFKLVQPQASQHGPYNNLPNYEKYLKHRHQLDRISYVTNSRKDQYCKFVLFIRISFQVMDVYKCLVTFVQHYFGIIILSVLRSIFLHAANDFIWYFYLVSSLLYVFNFRLQCQIHMVFYYVPTKVLGKGLL